MAIQRWLSHPAEWQASFADYHLLSTAAHRSTRGGQPQPTRSNATTSSNIEKRKTVNPHQKINVPDDARSARITPIFVAQCSGSRLSPARGGDAHSKTASHVPDQEIDLAQEHRHWMHRRRSSFGGQHFSTPGSTVSPSCTCRGRGKSAQPDCCQGPIAELKRHARRLLSPQAS